MKINLYGGSAHKDDIAVWAFGRAMQEKLAAARHKGRSGWDEDDPWLGGVTTEQLRAMLREHVHKGDPVDVANIAMMLWHRIEGT